MDETILIDNANTIIIDELHSAARTSTTSFINDAAVEVTLLDANGDEVAGQTWPVTLDYVAASDGRYVGNLSESLELTEQAEGILLISIVSDDLVASVRRPVRFAVRTG